MGARGQSGAAPGKSAARARVTRAALVELAAEMFAEQGYVQTSIRDIARRGSLTSGAIYGHFRNKADLLAEAIHVRTSEELEAGTLGAEGDVDHVEALTRAARDFPKRRRLRALIVQGAAAALTDEETRSRLRDEQLSHVRVWIDAYSRDRDRLGIDPAVDLEAVVLHTWATELGLGVLEALDIQPKRKGWADVQNRLARSLRLAPDEATTSRRRTRR